MSAIPRIDSPGPSSSRPFWSVMMPVYNAPAHYFEQALRSVLQQDQGPERMQIEVIDHGSTEGDVSEIVRRLAGSRVTVHHEPRNLGLCYVLNQCIKRARGEWVHILPHDDLVLPGFYEMLNVGATSDSGLLYCRHAYIDGDGLWLGLSGIDARRQGIMDHAVENFVRLQRVQIGGALVRRSVYEALGEFRPDLCYTLDWEMWCRIAQHYGVWYEPAVLACFRIHTAAETSRLVLEGRDIEDVRKCVAIISGYLSDPKSSARVRKQALKHYASNAVDNAWLLLRSRNFAAAYRQLRGALECGVSVTIFGRLCALLCRSVRRVFKRLATRALTL